MIARSLFATLTTAALGLSGLLAQSAPAPRTPASDPLRFQRVAEELRRAGDEKLAEELMQAARKLAGEKEPPAPGARVARRAARAPTAGGPVAVPVLGELFLTRRAGAAAPEAAQPPSPPDEATPAPAPVAPAKGDVGSTARTHGFRRVAPAGVPSLEVTVPGATMPAAPPVPQAGGAAGGTQVHQHTHRHEVHHYFHGAPPAGMSPMTRVVPPAQPGQTPAPHAQARTGGRGVAATPATPRVPAPPAATPAPPSNLSAPAIRVRSPRVMVPGGVTGQAPAPSPQAQPRSGGAAQPSGEWRTRSAAPAAGGGQGGRYTTARPLSTEVDGLRHEVEQLRELLEKLRAQLRSRSPN